MTEVLEQTETLPDEQRHSVLSRALLNSWARRDAGSFAAWFGSDRVADVLHQDARDALALRLSQGDPAEVLPWMATWLPRAARQELYGSYFRELAKQDPGTAGAHLRELNQTTPGDAVLWNDLVGQLAAQWAEADLTQALAWARSLPEGPAKSEALLQMSTRWTRDDPLAAAADAARRNEPALIENVAVLWAQRNLHGALAWATALPPGDGRNAAISRLTGVWSRQSPEAAVAYASGIPSEDTRVRATIEAVSGWAEDKPERAAEWVRQLPEGRLREQAMGEVLNAWSGHQPDAAGRWLQGLPPTPSRDASINTFCGLIDSAHPDMAFQWAATISDEATRNQRLADAAISWLETDRRSALPAITRSRLPDSLKARLLADIDSRAD
jgi:hypothetical protein